MAENGILDYQGMNQAIYRGATSNIVVDTQSMSIEIGAGNSSHTSNLHIECDHAANVASIQLNSNVVTEFSRSKKLIKYPRVAMTSDNQPAGYVASASTSHNSGNYNPYKAFNNTYESDTTSGWASDSSAFSNQDPSSSAASFNNDLGEYLTIQLPNKIKLETHHLFGRQDIRTNEFPVSAKLYASNDNFTSFELIESYEDLAQPSSSTEAQVHNINETRYFQYYRLMVTKTSGTQTYAAVGEWELYGVPEYDPDAHGTDVAIKSIPNVPNTDWLEVYYDGQDYSTMPATVDNKTGVSTYDATPNGGVGFDPTYKAFTFNKTDNQYLSTSTPMSGNYVHSFSAWFKPNSLTAGSGDALFYVGATSGSSDYKIELFMESDRINYTFGGNNFQAYPTIENGKWYHITVTYNGVGGQNGREIYLNNVKLTATHSISSGVLNLPNNSNLDIGRYTPDGSATTSAFDGSIANFRLFNRVLTSDEIYQLYTYQKEYFGHSTNNMTLKAGRLGIGTSEPRAALDVRGDIIGGCPVFFRAWKSTDTIGGVNPIIWNEIMVNKGSGYSTVTGKFTAPVSGYYEFIYGGCSGRTDWSAEMHAHKNDGNRIVGASAYAAGGSGHWGRQLVNTMILELNVGDTFHLSQPGTGTSSQDMYGGSTYSYNFFSGKYLSN